MANKKITELPIVYNVTASGVGLYPENVVPVVVGGTTWQISLQNLSKYASQYSATTASNTFIGNQTITGSVSVSGTTAIGGNTTIGGTLVVAGRLTAEEFHTEITTASVIYSSGSTKFGDTSNDTHEFTGSIQIGGETLGNAGLNAFTASAGGVITGIQAYTQSLKAAAIVSSSTQIQNYDLFALNSNLYTSTGSLRGITNGLMAYTQSLKAAAIVSSSTQISNYYKFAETASANIFYNNQTITGSLKVSTSITASTLKVDGLNYPTADSTANSFVQTDGAGNLSLQFVQTIHKSVKNAEAITIPKGSPLFVSESNGGNPNVYFADAGNPLRMPATFIADENITAGSTGRASVLGLIEGVNTTGYPAGTEVYVAVGGGWTPTRPTGSAQVQPLGIVTKEGNGGQGVILNPGVNGLPNITEGYLWVGNHSSYPTPIATSSFELSGRSLVSSSAQLPEIGGLEAYTASLKAAGIVSSSTQITNYYTYAETSSANFFYNNQTISGSLKVRDGITGSLKGNVDGTATYAGTVNVQNSSTNQDYTLLFANAGTNGYLSIYTDSIPGLYYNPSTNRLNASASIHSIVGGITGSIMATNGVVSASAQITELTQIGPIQAYTASLKSVITINGNDVNFAGKITAQEIHTTLTTSSVLYQSGSSKFGDSLDDKHEFTGSLNVSGSSHTIQNGYVILQHVSQSLNFVDDTAAAVGGVPLGGLYRNGNFIVIRIV